MKKALLFAVILFGLTALTVFSQTNSKVSDDYYGQEPPGLSAEVFAPGVISTSMSEWCICMTPDKNEIYYGVTGSYAVIVTVRKDGNGRWSGPEIASFSGNYSDYEPAMSPDGKRLYFVSNRPLEQTGPPKQDTDIWYVERTANGWGEAVHTGPNVNSDEQEFYPSIASDGTMYFTAKLDGDSLGYGIYSAEPDGASFGTPVRLSDSVNAEVITGHCYVAPDESYLIYSSNGRDDGKGQFDLYVSFRNDNGSWTKSRNLGDRVNSPGADDYPFVSPDGKYIFFTSVRRTQPRWNETALTFEHLKMNMEMPGNGSRDIYWIDASILDSIKAAQTAG